MLYAWFQMVFTIANRWLGARAADLMRVLEERDEASSCLAVPQIITHTACYVCSTPPGGSLCLML
jgi:hypothetical protein